VFTVGWFLLSRRGIVRGRPVVLFDIGVFVVIGLILAALWWCNRPEKARWDDGDYDWFAVPFF
jgi:hypothetical protein